MAEQSRFFWRVLFLLAMGIAAGVLFWPQHRGESHRRTAIDLAESDLHLVLKAEERAKESKLVDMNTNKVGEFVDEYALHDSGILDKDYWIIRNNHVVNIDTSQKLTIILPDGSVNRERNFVATLVDEKWGFSCSITQDGIISLEDYSVPANFQ